MNKETKLTNFITYSHRILSYVYKYLTHELEAHMSYDLGGGGCAPPPFPRTDQSMSTNSRINC